MKNNIKKTLCLILALLTLLGVMPLGASAAREVTEGMYTYYITQTGKCIITKGDPSLSGDITIPDKLGGVAVKEIDSSAFADNKLIISVTFPETLVEIADNAFYNCDALTEIVIPDTVTSIGEKAFAFCSMLVSATIGNGITEIPPRAFYSCEKLKNVTMRCDLSRVFSTKSLYCIDILK